MRNSKIQNTSPNGMHIIIDLNGCDPSQLNSPHEIESIFKRSLEGTEIILLNSHFKKFEPYGVTGVFSLSASHASIHTWPESKYCTIDIFTCSEDVVTNKIYRYILNEIIHESSSIRKIRRGYKYNNFENHERKLRFFSTGETLELLVQKTITSSINEFQKIELLETAQYGKCLLLDDILQISEVDQSIYSKAFFQKILPIDTNILVVGGEDGFIAKYASETYDHVKNISVVGRDEDVTEVCKKEFHDSNFDKRINFIYQEASSFLAGNSLREYNYVVYDLIDDLEHISKQMFYNHHYHNLSLLRKSCKNNTRIAIYAGSVESSIGINAFNLLSKILTDLNIIYTTDEVEIPSFCENAVYIFCTLD